MHAFRKFTIAGLATGLAIAGGFSAQAAEHTKRPKVSLAQAQKTALAARPGKVTDHELEAEKGGSGLRYSFDILAGGKTYEVGVDAMTGQLLENIAEGRNPD